MAYKMLIGGRLVDGAKTLDVINPTTGGLLEVCPRANEAQLDEAVAAAAAAFPAWAALSFAERRKALDAVADAVEARSTDIARQLTLEVGKPLAQAEVEVMAAVWGLRTYAAAELSTRLIRETDAERILELRDPLGVVGSIMPWNFPILSMAAKVGPALITGNTVVAKPAPTTPLSALLFAAIANDHLPPGVLNVIVDDNDLGPLMTRHPGIAKVSFTGSTETGRKVMEGAAASIKRLTLELGGNDAAIVLDDADVMTVAPKIFEAAMSNSGQICLATKRVYAHASIYDALCAELARLAGEAVVDDGLTQGVTMGPIQNKAQFEKVKDFLADAHANGSVIAGGAVIDRDGYFVQPTIVRDISDGARLVREEQFGPILPVMKYDTIEDAIARTNDSPYGLGGSVWTSNVARGVEVASKVQSGTVWVNKWLDVPFDVPFRGAKQSGIGAENGEAGLQEYTQARIINVAL